MGAAFVVGNTEVSLEKDSVRYAEVSKRTDCTRICLWEGVSGGLSESGGCENPVLKDGGKGSVCVTALF